jgi:hypothetical protein
VRGSAANEASTAIATNALARSAELLELRQYWSHRALQGRADLPLQLRFDGLGDRAREQAANTAARDRRAVVIVGASLARRDTRVAVALRVIFVVALLHLVALLGRQPRRYCAAPT